MKLMEFLDAAQQYASLGWATHEQFRGVAAGGPLEKASPYTLITIAEFLDAYPELEGADELSRRIADHVATVDEAGG